MVSPGRVADGQPPVLLRLRGNQEGRRAGFIKNSTPGSFAERLQRCREKLAVKEKHLVNTLDRLCGEYVQNKMTSGDPVRLHKLEALIEGIDSEIMMNRRGPEVLATILTSITDFGRTLGASHQI